MNRLIVTVAGAALICLSTMGAASSCEGSPARSATAAGDGITQFGNPNGPKNYANEGATGKLKWGVTYNAHKQNPTDVENCRWSLFAIDPEGVTHFIKKGNYANAKIKVGEQRTRRFFLKSLECGLWEK